MTKFTPGAVSFGHGGASWRLPLALLAIGASLPLAACSRPSNETSAQTNAATPASPPAAASAQPAEASLSAQMAEKRRHLVADAATALQETQTALGFLANNRTDDAVAALERAIGKLDLVLAAEPSLALAPVDVRVRTYDIVAAPDAIRAVRTRAAEAVAAGQIQVARHLLADLASEHVISVTSLPLATYPAAIRQAAALVHAGNAPGAATVLESALGTLVVQDTIIPLPLARAEALLDQAAPLTAKAQRSPAENEQLRRLIAAAREQLQRAQLLGYATESDLRGLLDELTVIERRTEGQGSGPGLLDRIKALFTSANSRANPQTGR
jgi:hypothetical protein